ncbi:MAG: hypothetical protein LBC55_09295 [Desulfovibrio sp.]|nr:hypothetical protein [Desulfovibrio sp.]
MQPKVFSITMNSPVTPLVMTIDNRKRVYNTGHDWTFTGSGNAAVTMHDFQILGGKIDSSFDTTFSNIDLSTINLDISDYNTLRILGGSLEASRVVLDAGVLEFRGSKLTTGSITGKRDSSLKITAQGNSTTLMLGPIFTTNVIFSDTYGASPGYDYSITFSKNSMFGPIENSPIMIGDAYSSSWVEFAGAGMVVGMTNLNIAPNSRLTIAGDKIFNSGSTVTLAGSGTLRLTGDLLNKNITSSAFTGTYDLNGHKLWLDAVALGRPRLVQGGGELNIGL